MHHVDEFLDAGGGAVQHGLLFVGELDFDDLLDATGSELNGGRPLTGR